MVKNSTIILVLLLFTGTAIFSPGGSIPASGRSLEVDQVARDPVLVNRSLTNVNSALQQPLLEGDEPEPERYGEYFEATREDKQAEADALLSENSDYPSTEPTSASYDVEPLDWRNLRPTESYLRSVSMLPSSFSIDCSTEGQKSKGWIVGDGNAILGYCNGLWDHVIAPSTGPATLWDVQALLPYLGVAVGDAGAVLMYLWDTSQQDYGWIKMPIPVSSQSLIGLSMIPDGSGGFTGWAVGNKRADGLGTLVRGTLLPIVVDGRNTFSYVWLDVTDSYPNLPDVDMYTGVHVLSQTDGWAVGGISGVKGVAIHWNGTTWTPYDLGTQRLVAVHARSANDVWAVGMGGVIYHFTGSTWQAVASPTVEMLVDVTFDEGGVGWITGRNGAILKFANGTWSLFDDLRTDKFDFKSVDFTSGHGWMVGFHLSVGLGGQILEYEDGLWLAVTPPTDNRLNDLAVVSDNDAWAVGAPDASGGTILHWDGRHWQRWYQTDLPIPAVELTTVDMATSTNGWIAGDPPVAGAAAVLLHWDGHRWAPPRYDAPVNVRINDIDMLDKNFGWAVASTGNAESKYDGAYDIWTANPTCGGVYYDLRGVSIREDSSSLLGWDGWTVGTSLNPASGEYFLDYIASCGGRYAWEAVQHPVACAPVPNPDDGWSQTKLRDVSVLAANWGYATGNYKDRASIYYSTGGNPWSTVWCEAQNSTVKPSQFYSLDIVEDSGVTWFGGYHTNPYSKRKVASIMYRDTAGFSRVPWIYPLNGVNIYDRPIRSIDMSSDTMGWAVGDPEDSGKRSIMYQYPFPNFTLDAVPAARAVRPGESANYEISANSIGGFSADVTLSVLLLPPGITASLNPSVIAGGTPADLTLQTDAAMPLGVYEVPILGMAIFKSGDVDVPVYRVSFVHITVTEHPIYSVSPSKGPAGTVVTITGSNFGPDPGPGSRSTPANHISWAGVQMPESAVTGWSNTQITFVPPDDPTLFEPQKFPLLGDVVVTASSTSSNADYYFQMENRITGLSDVESSGRILITLTGTSFGNDPGSLFRSTSFEHISFGGIWIPYPDVVSWSNHEIRFYVAASAPSSQIVVTSNGYDSNAVTYVTETDELRVFLPMLRR